MKSLTIQQIQDFTDKYRNDPTLNKNQRFGQAFCNEFSITDNVLFYQENYGVSEQYIWATYCDACASGQDNEVVENGQNDES